MPTTLHGVGGFTTLLNVVGTALTTAYTGNQVSLDTHGARTVVFYLDYTKGAETSAQIQVESWDGATWRVVPYLETGTVVWSKTATTKSRWAVTTGRFESKLRVSAKSTGSSDATTLVKVQCSLGSATQPISGNTV